MKQQVIKLCTFVLFLTVISFTKVNAQSENSSHFLGINPSVTVEPFYEKGELDINIFPLVYQTNINKRMDIRLATILNLGIRKNGNNLSHFGIETAIPVFLVKKESLTEYSKGFYAAPVISLTRNRIDQHNNIGLWIEPGYNLLFDDKFAMSFGLQLGATYFNYNNGVNKWGNHFGIKIIFGRWL